jgi:peptidyl-prolyl cis-trans isomerase B (cyclophilin B)
MVTIKLENGKEIKIELDYENAPNTAQNFVYLAAKGFYNGLIFHRVIKGFMIQGGDPTGTGMGGPGHRIKGEFKQNGIINNLKHNRGVVSMARSSDPNSAGSQFFIMHQDGLFLDGQYAAFGKVVSGMDAVDAIATTMVGANDRPTTPQKIKTIEVVNETVEKPEFE